MAPLSRTFILSDASGLTYNVDKGLLDYGNVPIYNGEYNFNISI